LRTAITTTKPSHIYIVGKIDKHPFGLIKEMKMSKAPEEPFYPSTFPPFTGKKIMTNEVSVWQANLGTGDEVYWNDPDEGICSGHATFIGHMSYVDGVSVIVKDGIKMQVFTKELS
jgi:hypothetical protein